MDCLARREHSVAELRAKLRAKNCNQDDIDAALERLAGEGLVSDARFAEAFVAARCRRGQGPVRIRAELRQRGVEDGLIANALDAAGGDWMELARTVRRRKFGQRDARDAKERARQMRFLQYRGFTTEQIRAAVSDDV